MKLNNRQDLMALRDEVLAHLNQAIGYDYGFKFSMKGVMRYDRSGAKLEFRIAVVDTAAADGADTAEAVDFKNLAASANFKPEDLGATFLSPTTGEMYRIIGWLKRSKKYPVLAERTSDLRRAKFPAVTVQKALWRAKAETEELKGILKKSLPAKKEDPSNV